jgi:transposase
VRTWRREARSGRLTPPEPEDGGGEPAAFVPIVAGPGAPSEPAPAATPAIEIALAGAVVRVLPGVDTVFLTAVLRAVRTATA